MTHLIAAPRVWLGMIITVEIAAAYGYMTACALTLSAFGLSRPRH